MKNAIALTRHSRTRMERGTLLDSCGCKLGAIAMGIALAVATAWYAWHWSSYPLSLGGMAARVALIAFVAAAVGKTAGMLLFRVQAKLRQ